MKRKEEKGKEKRLREAHSKPRRDPPVLVGQHSFLLFRKWPVVMPEMLSVTPDVIQEFTRPRIV